MNNNRALIALILVVMWTKKNVIICSLYIGAIKELIMEFLDCFFPLQVTIAGTRLKSCCSRTKIICGSGNIYMVVNNCIRNVKPTFIIETVKHHPLQNYGTMHNSGPSHFSSVLQNFSQGSTVLV
jgi:hypothetical protein